MRRQFSLATLLWVVAGCAVLFSIVRCLGYDGVIVAAPFFGAGAGGRLARREGAPARQRWAGATLAAGLVAIAVCQSDPRPYVTRPTEAVLGIPICLLYGLMAAAFLEAFLKIRRVLGQ
jgi:hypothetical protein